MGGRYIGDTCGSEKEEKKNKSRKEGNGRRKDAWKARGFAEREASATELALDDMRVASPRNVTAVCEVHGSTTFPLLPWAGTRGLARRRAPERVLHAFPSRALGFFLPLCCGVGAFSGAWLPAM